MKKVLKKITACGLILALACPVTGCGSKEQVKLSIWATEAKVDFVEEVMKAFQELHADEVELEWVISKENEDTCKETVLANPEGAADIFAFADDQLDELKDAGVLLALPTDVNEALEPFGGEGSVAYESVVRDGQLYAYPETANGYFLYYNRGYFSEDDVTSLEHMVEMAGNDNKKVTMDLSSGWYLYSFFQGAGMMLHTDETGERNICDWNRTSGGHTGVEVAESLLSITSSRGFKSLTDDDFVAGVEDGTVVAGVNGAWNADKISAAWGENYAATKLPTYIVGGDAVQMASYAGYKVVGANAHTEYPEWCQKILAYLTSKDNQVKEFEELGEVPANLEVADSEQVKNAPAVVALGEQSAYATLQRVTGSYWDASSEFGVTMASGNPDKRDLQELLDRMVEGITG